MGLSFPHDDVQKHICASLGSGPSSLPTKDQEGIEGDRYAKLQPRKEVYFCPQVDLHFCLDGRVENHLTVQQELCWKCLDTKLPEEVS